MERRERIVTNNALKPGVLKQALDLLRQERGSPRQIKGIGIFHERIYRAIRADEIGELACTHGMERNIENVTKPKRPE